MKQGGVVPEIQKNTLYITLNWNLTTQIYPAVTNPAQNQQTDKTSGSRREAIEHDFPPGLFIAIVTLTSALNQTDSVMQSGQLKKRLLHYSSRPWLRIIDEPDYLPLKPQAAHRFFQLISQHYHRGNLLITSKRTVSEWGEVFGDAMVTITILDQLLHHSRILTIRARVKKVAQARSATSCTRGTADQVWRKQIVVKNRSIQGANRT